MRLAGQIDIYKLDLLNYIILFLAKEAYVLLL
jgi:hypothetical protein